MKISVPWPIKKESQPRIKESLSLWENKRDVVICCVEETYDSFFDDFNYLTLLRNSGDIGSIIPKCYILDMIQGLLNNYPNEDWYGFGNSDCVPVGNLLANSENHDILIFHRTDIKKWENRFEPDSKNDLKNRVLKMREQMSDKKIAKILNHEQIPRPENEPEWTYLSVQLFCEDQGTIFIHGQDLYLFRKTVVQDVINNYLSIKDPILGTGGFDPRLSYWCMKNHKSVRVLHKLFHKRHISEWNPNEIEFLHNGGILTEEEWPSFLEDEFLLDLAEQGHRGSMSGWFMVALQKYNRSLWEVITKN